ncbi:MAG: DNA polymerase I [Bacteroidaceae bacterium]|nr:DNA polymerase I [Bacteroidaceae bacterium]
MKKLILLDAYALIYRAYYALIRTPRINSKGMNTSAIFGFINTLEEVLKKEEPDYIGVAFDPKGGTFRHEIYPEYKAQREATPEDIRTAVPIIKQILEAYNIPILEIPGYEADDVIGTLATQAAQLGGIITYMLTPDKDYGQLVTDSVKMLRPNHGGGFEIMGPQEICSKYGISSPLQVIDLLGLMGDAADNVPGCPGVGEKTAVKIIGEFGSIDQLLERSNELKGALKTKVENNIEGIRFSKMLVTIKTDVPIQLDLDRLNIKPKDNTRLAEIFDELEFRGLKSKLNQTSADSTIKSDRTKPQLSATNDLQLDLFAPSPKPVETTTPHTSSIFDDTSFQTSTVTDSKPRIASDGTLIGFDIKKHIVSGEIKEVPEKLFDIMIAYYVLRPDRRIYDDGNYSDERRQQLEDEMKREGVYRVFQEIEMPLLPVLARMEMNGVRLDTESLKRTSQVFSDEMAKIENKIYDLAGSPFNISSPRQVGEILFDRLKIVEKAKRTKTGQYVTSEEVLQSLKGKHEIVELILDYRGYKKLLSTYIDALPSLINPVTGHIHTSFNQAVTATGRLSSSNPNLQNIPIRDSNGKEVRKAFIPDDGCEFFSADYSQIELRIMAHLSQDPNMLEAFRSGYDIHAATAAKVFRKSIEEITPDERRKAKTANFGIIYGITTFGLAERMQVSRSEAKELIDEYFLTYSKVKEYMDKSIETARTKGYTETLFGRRCYLPDINSNNSVVRGYAERNAINAPIQGTAADIIKIAMVHIDRRMQDEKLRSKMILQVHDELNFSVFPDEKERLSKLVIEEMQNAIQLSVPLIADCGWGTNWLEAH